MHTKRTMHDDRHPLPTKFALRYLDWHRYVMVIAEGDTVDAMEAIGAIEDERESLYAKLADLEAMVSEGKSLPPSPSEP